MGSPDNGRGDIYELVVFPVAGGKEALFQCGPRVDKRKTGCEEMLEKQMGCC